MSSDDDYSSDGDALAAGPARQIPGAAPPRPPPPPPPPSSGGPLRLKLKPIPPPPPRPAAPPPAGSGGSSGLKLTLKVKPPPPPPPPPKPAAAKPSSNPAAADGVNKPRQQSWIGDSSDDEEEESDVNDDGEDSAHDLNVYRYPTTRFDKVVIRARKRIPGQHLRRARGSEMTDQALRFEGLDEPLLFDDKDSIGLVVPDPPFSATDVARVLGESRPISVLDVDKQQDLPTGWTLGQWMDADEKPTYISAERGQATGPAYGWTLGQWAQYFRSPLRSGIYNLISLEFSGTHLANMVVAPAFVRRLDWLENGIWPSFRKLAGDYPKVQHYCLMSVKGSYTDFHVDFGGSSVWYHVLSGRKEFWFVRPTPRNLQLYEQWVTSPKQDSKFFGQVAEGCFRVEVRAGQTLLIPTAWIHAVYTTEDAMVLGGNFLHSYGMRLQLAVQQMELRSAVAPSCQFPHFVRVQWYALAHYLHRIAHSERGGRDLASRETDDLPALLEYCERSLEDDRTAAEEVSESVGAPGYTPEALLQAMRVALQRLTAPSAPSNKAAPPPSPSLSSPLSVSAPPPPPRSKGKKSRVKRRREEYDDDDDEVSDDEGDDDDGDSSGGGGGMPVSKQSRRGGGGGGGGAGGRSRGAGKRPKKAREEEVDEGVIIETGPRQRKRSSRYNDFEVYEDEGGVDDDVAAAEEEYTGEAEEEVESDDDDVVVGTKGATWMGDDESDDGGDEYDEDEQGRPIRSQKRKRALKFGTSKHNPALAMTTLPSGASGRSYEPPRGTKKAQDRKTIERLKKLIKYRK